MNRRHLSCLLVTLAIAQVALAESRVDKTLKLEPGGRLEVDTEMGSVTVTGGSGSNVQVVVTSKNRELDELLTLRFEEGGKTARIIGRRKGSRLFNWSDGGRVHFEIQVPTATALDIDTSGGGIVVASIHSEVKLKTSGGSLELSLDPNADLEIDASANNVSTALPLKVQGEISRHHVRGTLGKGGASLRLHTSGGGIRIQPL